MQQGARLELSQRHELTITPQMQQAIAILLMSALELELHLQQELQDNPVLELDEPEVSPEEEQEESLNSEKKENDSDEKVQPESENVESENAADKDEKFDVDDIDYENLFSSVVPVRTSSSNDEEYRPPEPNDSDTKTLADYLLEQITSLSLASELEKTAKFIVSQLNSDGYLNMDNHELAELAGIDDATVNEAVNIIRNLEPPGVGARNTRDCLLIQLELINKKDSLEWKIVDEQFDMLTSNRIPFIAQALQADISAVNEAVDFIRTLEPRPGRAFGTDETNYIVPDVIVEKVEGEYVVSLRNNRIPSLRINKDYLKMYEREKKKKGEISEYLKSKFDSALWLVRSIEQRQKTLYRVSKSIVSQQIDFFEYGPKYLKPMTLKMVAEEIGVHESTVSRITTSKYMQTPRGTFELKYFFTSPISTSSGEDASSRSVKTILSEIIANEDPASPYSDQKLSELMKARGFTVARRTITKYREQLNIMPAKMRKKYS